MKTRIANWACAWRVVFVTAGLAGLGVGNVQGAGQATSFWTNTYGSGRLYQTTVERQCQGEASAEDVLEGGQVPILAEDIAMQVTQPIGHSTGTDGGLERAKLAGADSVDTVVVVDLDLVEQKLNEAAAKGLLLRSMASDFGKLPDDAVRFVSHTNCSPLVDVEHALQLAERMVRERRYESAAASLQTTRTQLGAYRAQADGPAGQGVSDLEHGIEKVSAQLQTLGAADKIRTMWHEVAGWAKRVPGGAQQAANVAQEARAEK